MPPSSPNQDPPSPAGPDRGPARLLIVDDEPLVLNLLASQAERLGYQVTTAVSGPEALVVLAHQRFELLLTDIMMPEMDGLALMQEARQRQPSLECIVISGQHQIKTAVEAMRQGAINYLPKPVAIGELEVALAKGMEKIGLQRQLRRSQQQLEQAARELAEETAKNKMILEAAGEGIIGLDLACRITFINRAALRMLAVDRAQALGRAFHTLAGHCREGGRLYLKKECPVCQACAEHLPFHSKELFFRPRKLPPFCVELVCTPMKEDGRVVGAVVIFSDITPQRAIEAELAQYRQHLEQLVEERTLELAAANARLKEDIKARRKAEQEAERRRQQLIEADKMASLGVLVAGVAHEINNPNNFITMNAPILRLAWQDALPILEARFREQGDFLMAGIPFSEMRNHVPELFAGILDGSDRIKKIVQNLRDYARQGASDMEQLFDLNQVVQAALSLLATPLRKSTHHLEVDLAGNLPRVRGNFQRAEQVVINLLQNAYQALPGPEERISIITRHDPDHSCVQVVVEDSGKGIAPRDLGRIQDPFFTTKRDSGGTGLGLSISAGIMEEHGGRLEFTSCPGKGTTARAVFPVAEQSTLPDRR